MLRNIFSDREFWFILLFNGFLALGYNKGVFSMDTLVWIYFMQSVILGISNTIRMACLKRFSSENFNVNGQPVEATPSTKNFSALFFMVHYGFFHFVYFIFLAISSLHNGSKLDFRMVMLTTLIMIGNAIVSTWSNVIHDREEKPSIASMFFTPYLRVAPMHLFIIIGFNMESTFAIAGFVFKRADLFWIFLTLKIIFDLLMHIVVQKSWKGIRVKPMEGYI